MKKKRINPHRHPATMADVEKAKSAVNREAVLAAYTIMFSVLLDKHNAPVEELKILWNEVEELSDSIDKGFVKFSDLRHAMKVEAGIEFK